MKATIKKFVKIGKRVVSRYGKLTNAIKPYCHKSPEIKKTSSNAPLNICVVGAGKQGRAIAKAVTRLENCNLSGLCDLNIQNLKIANETDGYDQNILFEDMDEMLSGRHTSLVFVATNASSHCEVARQVLKHDVKKLCVEKPIGTSMKHVNDLKEHSTKTEISVNHSRRWNLDYKHIKKVIDKGSLGKPIHGSVVWGPAGMGNMGVHLIDLVRMLTGDPKPNKAWGTLDSSKEKDPGGFGVIEFDNNFRLSIDTSALLETFHKTISLFFTSGYIIIDERSNKWTVAIQGESITYPLQDNSRNADRAARVVAGLLNENKTSCDIEHGIIALQCVLAIKASAAEKRWISAPFSEANSLEIQAR